MRYVTDTIYPIFDLTYVLKKKFNYKNIKKPKFEISKGIHNLKNILNI